MSSHLFTLTCIYLFLLALDAIHAHMSGVTVQSWRETQGVAAILGLVLAGVILRTTGATRAQISAAAADPQAYVTAAGADEFVLVLATAIAWLVLGWVILGAVLVLGSAAPGWIGWIFTRLALLLLPATGRRFVSLALGITLLGATSVASAAPPATMAAISVSLDWPGVAGPFTGAVPDWPPIPTESTGPPGNPEPNPPLSNSPGASTAASYVVQLGDCLWDIAERALAQANQPIDVTSVASAVTAWWQANSDHVEDPDFIYPGQVLQAPAP